VPADAEDLIFFAASKPRTPTTPEERERLERDAEEDFTDSQPVGEPVPDEVEEPFFLPVSEPRTPTTFEERERLENKAFEARRKKAQDDLDAMTAQPPVRRRVAR
jgi:hypothetical protein